MGIIGGTVWTARLYQLIKILLRLSSRQMRECVYISKFQYNASLLHVAEMEIGLVDIVRNFRIP